MRSAKGFANYQVVGYTVNTTGTVSISGYGTLDPRTAAGLASNWLLIEQNFTTGSTAPTNPMVIASSGVFQTMQFNGPWHALRFIASGAGITGQPAGTVYNAVIDISAKG
jgi:hypothetical protein